MNINYSFSDRTLHPSGYPLYVEQLFKVDIRTLHAGDYVDLGIERPALDGSGTRVLVENICVKITETHLAHFAGVVHMATYFHSHHGVRAGDAIRFEPQHILDIIFAKSPKVKSRLKFLAQILRVSRAFVAELLTLEEFPPEVATGYVLDDDLTAMIQRKGDDVTVLIQIAIVKAGLEGGDLAAAIRHSVAFSKAAKHLGVSCMSPDFDGPNDEMRLNILIVHTPMATTGQQLIRMITDQVAAVWQETNRFLAEQLGPTQAPSEGGRP